MIYNPRKSLDLSSPFRGTGGDYIVTGAGCAGLSLLMHLIHSGRFQDKKILLIDKDAKQSNDRTWCFWEEEEGLFEPIVYQQWQKLWFQSYGFSKELHKEKHMKRKPLFAGMFD